MTVASPILEYLARSTWRSRPGSFVALMSLYESNYLRASWLAGNLRALTGRQVSHLESDCDLILTVCEQAPYTTSIHLTYSFGEADHQALLPDMTVRLYHDARLAEAQSWAGEQQRAMFRSCRTRHLRTEREAQAERELQQRWARNMVLNKWLEYCVDRGHRFQPGVGSSV